jgi:transcriptional regulator, XRE family
MKNTLKVFRAMHDMTQEDVAKAARTSRQTINAIERDKYNPSLELAFKLSRIFDVKIEEIFFYEDR